MSMGGGDGGHLPAHTFQIAVNVLCLFLCVVTGLMHGVLRGNAHNTGAHMSLHARDTATGDDGTGTNGNSVCTQRDSLGRIDAVFDAAHEHDL